MNEKTVGMLAKFTGVSVHTIKYYEKIGLLSSTRREHSNYRSYDIRACTDIYECMKYKNLGFALKEVGNLIKEADSEAIDNLLKKRLEEIDASLSELQELKKRVMDYLAETEEIEKKQGNCRISGSDFRRITWNMAKMHNLNRTGLISWIMHRKANRYLR